MDLFAEAVAVEAAADRAEEGDGVADLAGALQRGVAESKAKKKADEKESRIQTIALVNVT